MVHSNQNCFITINNITPLFYHLPKSSLASNNDNLNGDLKHKDQLQLSVNFTFDELESWNKVKRKLIVIDGPHEIVDLENSLVSKILLNYLKHMFKTKIFNKILDED